MKWERDFSRRTRSENEKTRFEACKPRARSDFGRLIWRAGSEKAWVFLRLHGHNKAVAIKASWTIQPAGRCIRNAILCLRGSVMRIAVAGQFCALCYNRG